jgi:plasmid stability protein
MATPKRATVYFDPEVHKALRLRAAASDKSISDMVNEAVRASLAEDAVDLAAFDKRKRKRERSVSFDGFVQGMKQRGLL